MRPDGFIAIVPLLLLAAFRRIKEKDYSFLPVAVTLFLIGVGLAAAHLVFRHHYYGDLMPNTYTLKMTGHDLSLRLSNGMGFMKPYFRGNQFFWLAIPFAIWFNRENRFIYLALAVSMVLAIAYQLYVGGDPWQLWRQLCPAMAGMFIIVGVEFSALFHSRPVSNIRKIIAYSCLIALAIFLPNKKFWPEMLFLKKPYSWDYNQINLQVGLALRDILKPGATTHTVGSGVIPYYYGGYAIDALGKADRYIAQLEPDTVGASWSGMDGVPGHDKYDLHYSFSGKMPDYTQIYFWAMHDFTDFAREHYVAVRYGNENIFLCLKKNSTLVEWQKVSILGDCPSQAEKINRYKY